MSVQLLNFYFIENQTRSKLWVDLSVFTGTLSSAAYPRLRARPH